MTAPALVTGAGGFIGSHLVDTLVRAGTRVRALVHYNSAGRRGQLDDLPPDVLDHVEVIAGEIADPACVQAAVRGCGRVFHLAALIGIPYSYRAPQSYVRTNVDGTLNVLEACRAAGVERLVHTSTSEVYGSPESVPIDESHRLKPQSPYAATKAAADFLALSYQASFGIPVVVVRPFNTYGPRQSARAVIPTVITQALATGRVRLGATDTLRDFLFVADTARGFLAAGAAPGIEGMVIHLGTGVGTPIHQIVAAVAGMLGRRLEVESDPGRIRPPASEVDRLVCSAERARRLLGWVPEIDLPTGLARTLEWIRAHSARYRPQEYAV
ncbi:MAG: GDP-mannose 4,6-dehydratase [Pirellulales bacterium]